MKPSSCPAAAGGIAICAPIARYDAVREEVRGMVQSRGGSILAYLATLLETCEELDRKGLYAKARACIVKQFTGISDPYEKPDDAAVLIDTTGMSPEEAAQEILLYFERGGYIAKKGRNGAEESRIREAQPTNQFDLVKN